MKKRYKIKQNLVRDSFIEMITSRFCFNTFSMYIGIVILCVDCNSYLFLPQNCPMRICFVLTSLSFYSWKLKVIMTINGERKGSCL